MIVLPLSSTHSFAGRCRGSVPCLATLGILSSSASVLLARRDEPPDSWPNNPSKTWGLSDFVAKHSHGPRNLNKKLSRSSCNHESCMYLRESEIHKVWDSQTAPWWRIMGVNTGEPGLSQVVANLTMPFTKPGQAE